MRCGVIGMKTSVLFALLVSLALSSASVATTCTPSASDATGVGGLYVTNDGYVYQEANGIEGLQRDDVAADDTCGGDIQPDAFIANA